MNIFNALFNTKTESNFKDLVSKGALIIDVRSPAEYTSGHVKGSRNIPLDVLEKEIEKLGAKDKVIITCCASGGRSSMAKSILEKAGHSNVHNGGGWRSLNGALQ